MSYSPSKMCLFTDIYLEKYAKKLVGRNDIEDALKRLDKLTQEEARIAIAENLRAAQNVEDKVKIVIDSAQNACICSSSTLF